MKTKIHSEHLGTLRSYIIGFVLSLLLTLLAYFVVEQKLFSHWHTILVLSTTALLQALAQLIFFLHLGQEKSPFWNLQTFLFMLGVLLILVLGTLWIMYNLDYYMMVK